MGGGLFDAYRPIDLTPHLGALPYSPRPTDKDPQSPYPFYMQRRNHGIEGSLVTKQLDDIENLGKPDLERVLLTYRIGGYEHDIFTVQDVIHNTHEFLENTIGNIRGPMFEGICRTVIRELLDRKGVRWVRFSDDHKRDHYTIIPSNEYEIKTIIYPNAVVLEKLRGEDGREYMEAMTDLDGLFECEYGGQSHTIVAEAKSGNWEFNYKKLARSVFTPLHHLLKNDRMAYVMFSTQERTLHRYQLTRTQIQRLPEEIRRIIPESRIVHRLNPQSVALYRTLQSRGIDLAIFTGNETRGELDRAAKFLINIYKQYQNRPIGEFEAVVSDSMERTIIKEGNATPRIEYILNPETGEYKKITHGSDIIRRLQEAVQAQPVDIDI
jgi:hypothetical protein